MGLSERVTQFIVAHIELMCTPDGSQKEAEALKKCDAIYASLTEADRIHIGLVAQAVRRGVSRAA